MLTEKQIEMRRTGIGASECAVVAGLSPFATAIDLFNAKVFGAAQAENNAMRAGNFLEDGAAKMYAAHLLAGLSLRKVTTRRHPQRPWQLATVDREIVRGRARVGLVEIKVPGSRHFWNRETGERELAWGTAADEIPAHIACQAQWQMDVLDSEYCDVVAFFLDTRELAVFRQQRNQAVIDDLVRINERFWFDNILKQEPPALDGTAGARTYLNQKYPKNAGSIVPSTEEIDSVADAYAKVCITLKYLEEDKDELGNRLRGAIGTNDGVEGSWGKATWKLDARGKVDYRTVAAEYRLRIELLASAAQNQEAVSDLDAIVEKNRSAPSRVLRVNHKAPLEGPLDLTVIHPGKNDDVPTSPPKLTLVTN